MTAASLRILAQQGIEAAELPVLEVAMRRAGDARIEEYDAPWHDVDV
jgi:hypothetical protein